MSEVHDHHPIPLSHSKSGGRLSIHRRRQEFVFLTTTELKYKHPGGMDFAAYRDFTADADLLIHDAEYDDADYKKKKTWGTQPTTGLQLAQEAGVKRSDYIITTRIERISRWTPLSRTVKKQSKQNHGSLQCFAVRQDMEIEL